MPPHTLSVTAAKIYYDFALRTVVLWWSDMKNVKQYQVPLTVGTDKNGCPFYALSGNIHILF